jgi:hypothetical protein
MAAPMRSAQPTNSARYRAIARRFKQGNSTNPNPGWSPVGSDRARAIGSKKGQRPQAPDKKDLKYIGNPNRRKVYDDMYKANVKAYKDAKPGSSYKQQSIKTGGGYRESDFGYGNKGPGIPYMIQETSFTKDDTPQQRKDRMKKAIIERRKKDSKKKK